MSEVLDPRRHAVRPDLADAALRGRVDASAFVEPVAGQIARPAVPLRKTPSVAAGFETEALHGEAVHVFETSGGWAWVQLIDDGYVGYLPADALGRDSVAVTHKVKGVGTFVYSAPDIKAPPLMHLSLGARVAVVGANERFYEIAGGGFIVSRHLAEIGWSERDFVDVAERLIATPYLWGGKTRIGLDCSALVQVSLAACGVRAPRDSDMQRAELGTEIAVGDDLEGLMRGDLVFWPGHVGIMSDGVMMVHANAHHMAVVAEPLPEAAARIKGTGADLLAVKRLHAAAA